MAVILENGNPFGMDRTANSSIKTENMGNLNEIHHMDPGLKFAYEEIVSATQDLANSENLIHLHVKTWVVFLRKDFDCTVNDEPYHALSFLFNLETGQFLIRVWNKTFKKGFVKTSDNLKKKLCEAFEGKVPCLGHENEDRETMMNCVTTDFPFRRDVSVECQFVAQSGTDTYLCKPCAIVSETHEVQKKIEALQNGLHDDDFLDGLDDDDDDIEPKVEVKEEDFAAGDDFLLDNHSTEEDSDYTSEDDEYVPSKRGRKRKVKSVSKSASKIRKKNSAHSEDKSVVRMLSEDARHPPAKGECDQCGVMFNSRPEMRAHKVVEHYASIYNCPSCREKFMYPFQIVSHVTEKHQDLDEIACKKCKTTVEITQFMDHIKSCIVETSTNYQKKKPVAEQGPCKYCNLFFDSSEERKKHIDSDHHGTNKFICRFCDDKPFNKPSGWKNHMRKFHMYGDFRCPMCEVIVSYYATDYVTHFTQKHPEQMTAPCDICSKEIPLTEYVEHNKTCKKEEAYQRYKKLSDSFKARGIQCRHCDLKFENHDQRMTHEAVHVGERYRCNQCDYKSMKKCLLKAHMKRHNQNEEHKICCDLCGKKITPDNMKNHIRYMHEGKKDNETCEICGAFFDRHHKLYMHMNLVHSDDPKFACAFCGKRFGRVALKESHELKHKDATFACDICGKTLKKKKSLIVHMRIHTGEKPYK